MELHQALKQIINLEGQDILTQPRVVNMLSDLQAYQKIPAAKYIIVSMINDGFMLKFLQKGKWNHHCERLVVTFVNNTGFQHDLVSIVFQSVAVALCWKTDVVVDPSNHPKPTHPNFPSPIGLNLGHEALTKRSDTFVANYIEKSEEYLDSIIEIKGNWEKDFGAKLEVSSQYQVCMNNSSVCLNFEILGRIKRSIDKDVFIHVVFYNHKGKIIDRSYGYLYHKVMTSSYNVVTSGPISETGFKNIENIKRVVVYWELSSTTL